MTFDSEPITPDSPGEWYQFTFDEPAILTKDIVYAIVIHGVPGLPTPYVYWRDDPSAPEYPRGNAYRSINSGVSWTRYLYDDLMFEDWGYPLTNDDLSPNGNGEPGDDGGNHPQEDEIMLKSGQSTAPAHTETQVDFTTPFTGTPSVVFVAYAENDKPYLIEVTPTYFKWNNASKNTPVTVDWVATDNGNL
ncbi:hypothetical protein ES708_34203 [subsurface metagenome]